MTPVAVVTQERPPTGRSRRPGAGGMGSESKVPCLRSGRAHVDMVSVESIQPVVILGGVVK